MQESFPKIMLVDMNSFFASVEQQANPRFRNRPLGVVASMHPTSCLIAASKEAKLLGIKTGSLIYKAQKICPEIVLVQAEPEKYREVNRRLVEIFCDYTDKVDVYSIDEAFLDLSYSGSSPLAIGTEIKSRIRDEVGEWLTCSVGIAPNKFMAKLAADLQKPDGLSVVWRSNLPEIYKHKNFTDLWGVARGWSRRLNSLGLQGPSQVLSYPVGNLVAAFGKPGFYIWQRIQGLEIDKISSSNRLTLDGSAERIVERLTEDGSEPFGPAVNPYAQPGPIPSADRPKSFGHSWVLNFRTKDKSRLAPVILRLAEKGARRMRAKGFQSRLVFLSATDVVGNFFRISKKLDYSISTGQELYELALKLWRNWQFRHDIMHIAVGFGGLLRQSQQLDLFGSRNPALTRTLDAINDKYGEFTIRSGLLTRTADFAPDAIAFGH
ncbi:MAG TPA: DNA polymerase IV [Patescibacteria group bacterium]|nr:DNA polymerase IV [Patescibacteria group bacterium]